MGTSATATIQPQFRMIDALKIRCADTDGSQEATLLLTSPWPESLYAFAPMWATLAKHARLLATTPSSASRTSSRQTSVPRPRCSRRLPNPTRSRA
jgi:hypothetical protein